MTQSSLDALLGLSHRLGDPGLDYVILGEGNTSAREDKETFWVKASGSELRSLEPAQLVRVRFPAVLELLEAEDPDDETIKEALIGARVDPEAAGHPSVETLLHAVCLQLEGVDFVAHTHPTAINALTCSERFEEALAGRLFPDEIVVCGPAPLLVPYTDPGVPLAREIGRRAQAFIEEYGERPRAVYLQNHGFVALGGSPGQVEGITAMAVKIARVLAGSYALGGPHPMTPQAVDRIRTRPDEHRRQRVLGHR